MKQFDKKIIKANKYFVPFLLPLSSAADVVVLHLGWAALLRPRYPLLNVAGLGAVRPHYARGRGLPFGGLGQPAPEAWTKVMS